MIKIINYFKNINKNFQLSFYNQLSIIITKRKVENLQFNFKNYNWLQLLFLID